MLISSRVIGGKSIFISMIHLTLLAIIFSSFLALSSLASSSAGDNNKKKPESVETPNKHRYKQYDSSLDAVAFSLLLLPSSGIGPSNNNKRNLQLTSSSTTQTGNSTGRTATAATMPTAVNCSDTPYDFSNVTTILFQSFVMISRIQPPQQQRPQEQDNEYENYAARSYERSIQVIPDLFVETYNHYQRNRYCAVFGGADENILSDDTYKKQGTMIATSSLIHVEEEYDENQENGRISYRLVLQIDANIPSYCFIASSSNISKDNNDKNFDYSDVNHKSIVTTKEESFFLFNRNGSISSSNSNNMVTMTNNNAFFEGTEQEESPSQEDLHVSSICDPPSLEVFLPIFHNALVQQNIVAKEDDSSSTTSTPPAVGISELKVVHDECNTSSSTSTSTSTSSAFTNGENPPFKEIFKTSLVLYFQGEESTTIGAGSSTINEGTADPSLFELVFTTFIERAVMDTYGKMNRFQEGFCDPFGRHIESVTGSLIEDPANNSILHPNLKHVLFQHNEEEGGSGATSSASNMTTTTPPGNGTMILLLLEMEWSCIWCNNHNNDKDNNYNKSLMPFDILTEKQKNEENDRLMERRHPHPHSRYLNQNLEWSNNDNDNNVLNCLCPVNNDEVKHRGPTQEEFQHKLDHIIQSTNISGNQYKNLHLENIVIVEAVTCNSLQASIETARGEQEDHGNYSSSYIFNNEPIAVVSTNIIIERILVDLVVNCSLVDVDSAFLTNEFMNIYNTLNEERYCDPYLRHISSARLIRRGERRADDTLTIELELNGTCVGCDPNIDGFYGITSYSDEFLDVDDSDDGNVEDEENKTKKPVAMNETFPGFNGTSKATTNETMASTNESTESNNSTQRNLLFKQEVEHHFLSSSISQRKTSRYLSQDNMCYCPVHTIANRAPSESEVIHAFREFVHQSAQKQPGIFRCVDSIGQCQFGSTFESSIIVAFARTDSTDSYSSSIELSMQIALNNLFTVESTICNRDFRLVQSVSATLGVNLAGEEELQRHLLLSASEGNIFKDEARYLQNTGEASLEPAILLSESPANSPVSSTTKSSQEPSGSPFSSFDSSAATVTGSVIPSFVPSLAPSTVYTSSIIVLFNIKGICNGCQNSFIFSNEITAGNPQQGTGYNRAEHSFERKRSLQESGSSITFPPEANSNCFCPIGSLILEDSALSIDAVLVEYQNQLNEGNIPLDARAIKEVEIVDCKSDIQNFSTEVSLQFILDPEMSSQELDDLIRLVERTYNNLTDKRFCDPLMRRVKAINVLKIDILEEGQGGCNLVSIKFNISGRCRGCNDDSPLFDSDDNEDYDRKKRNLEGNDLKDRNIFEFIKQEKQQQPYQHRRRVQGSEICICERQTEADRAPSLKEFEDVLGREIAKKQFNHICGLSDQFENLVITKIPSSPPSSTPSEKPTACEATLENEFESELVLYVEDQNLDTVTINQLGDSILTAYNSLVEQQYTLCDPSYRLIKSISPIVPEQRRERQLRRTSTTKQFFDSDNVFATRRRLQNGNIEFPFRYKLVGQCELCGIDSNFLDIISGEEVLTAVKALQSGFMNVNILLRIVETDTIACSNTVVKFEEVVIVEFVPSCPNQFNFGFDDTVKAEIQQAFVSTYNKLAASYCDRFFRTAVNAVVETVGSLNIRGQIPLEIRIFAKCLGCNPDEDSIYANPSEIRGGSALGSRSGRQLVHFGSGHIDMEPSSLLSSSAYGVGSRLLQSNEACSCSAQAVAYRAPSEAEFIQAFQENMEILLLPCIASVGECQFGSTFNTDIVLSFEGNQTILNEEIRLYIQESFRALLNDLYNPTPEVCNPEFRVFVDVEVAFDFTLNGEFIEAEVNSGAGMEDDSNTLIDDVVRGDGGIRRQIQVMNLTSGNTTNPSNNSDSPFPSSSPSASPTIVYDSNLIRTLLSVSGICNGCPNELFVSDQVYGNRALFAVDREETSSSARYSFLRQLQQTGSLETTSNCFCPLTSSINLNPFTSSEIIEGLSRRLEKGEVDLVVRSIDTVSSIACDDEEETTTFTSVFTFPFSAFAGISDAEIQKLGNLTATVYNELVEDYCDPLIRREVTLQVIDRTRVIEGSGLRRKLQDQTGENFEGGQTGTGGGVFPNQAATPCVNFKARFAVEGKCRGCQDGTPLLDGGIGTQIRSLEAHNRILSSGKGKTKKTRRRHLQNDDEECFCDSRTIAPRAPNINELWSRLEIELPAAITLPNVCGRPVACNPSLFPYQFSDTTILALLLEPGTIITESHLLDLEATFLTAYNSMQELMREDKCGGSYRQMALATADRSILGRFRNLVDGDEMLDSLNRNGDRRRLAPVASFVLSTAGGCPRDCPETGGDYDVKLATVDSIEDLTFVVRVIAIDEFMTGSPSNQPSVYPSGLPSLSPSISPSTSPSTAPSTSPSTTPSTSPSTTPSTSPSTTPSTSPSTAPSTSPSTLPSTSQSLFPSAAPTKKPSTAPSSFPSLLPSYQPSAFPSVFPSLIPSSAPSSNPSGIPTSSINPSVIPSINPSSEPSLFPSSIPSSLFSQSPTGSISPSIQPSLMPSASPSGLPSSRPSRQPSSKPSIIPSVSPSSKPSLNPSSTPSSNPSSMPSSNPSSMPSTHPSSMPSSNPSSMPSTHPSSMPSSMPSSLPSTHPSSMPSSNPSSMPSSMPSLIPSSMPSLIPSSIPSSFPSVEPSSMPSATASSMPSAAPTSLEQLIFAILRESIPDLPSSNFQQQALNWIYADPPSISFVSDGVNTSSFNKQILLERFVLVTFYYALNGSKWVDKNNWLSAQRVYTWDGVLRCENNLIHSPIYELGFGINNLSGSIPTLIGLLTGLRFFGAVEHPNQVGTIPTQIGLLTELTGLSFYYTSMNGPIPTEIGKLTKLRYLSVFNTNISGTIPTEVTQMKSLAIFELAGNKLAGSIPLSLYTFLDALPTCQLNGNAGLIDPPFSCLV